MSKRSIMVGLFVCCVALVSVRGAKADPIAFVCTGSTTCTAGSVTIQSGLDPTFDFIYHPDSTLTGTGFIGVLVPNGTATLTVNVGATSIPLEESKSFTSGDLGSLLGEVFTDYNLSSFQSASAAAGITANSFTAYEFNLGSFSSPGQGAAGISNISVSGAPFGTVIVGWVEDDITLQTPLSESITVPEPTTPVLFGFGLVALLCVGMIRRRSNGTSV